MKIPALRCRRDLALPCGSDIALQGSPGGRRRAMLPLPAAQAFRHHARNRRRTAISPASVSSAKHAPARKVPR